MHGRLRWLLTLMLGVLMLRWMLPLGARPYESSATVVDVADFSKKLPLVSPVALQRPAASVPASRQAVDVPGNIFPVRQADASTPALVPHPTAPKISASSGPKEPPAKALPAPPPPPPFQIIGTWDDGKALAVFIATPFGTELARADAVLLAEYLVTDLTEQHVVLTHTTSRQEWRLFIPRVRITP